MLTIIEPNNDEKDNLYYLIVNGELCKVWNIFCPLHQGIELLLSGKLELCLIVRVHSHPSLVQLKLITVPLGLMDPLCRHVPGPQVAVLTVPVLAHTLVALAPLSLLLDCLSLHPAGDTFVVTTELTPVTLPLVNQTVPVFTTSIRQLFTNSSLEEALELFEVIVRVHRKHSILTLQPSQE